MTNKKRLTNRDRKERAEFRRQMQEKGILPPDKPKLNRKKFIAEAKAEWDNRGKGCFVWDVYIMYAISYMLGHLEKDLRPSREAVGVAKVLKIALRLREFTEKLEEKGEHEYRVIDQYNYIKDILDA